MADLISFRKGKAILFGPKPYSWNRKFGEGNNLKKFYAESPFYPIRWVWYTVE